MQQSGIFQGYFKKMSQDNIHLISLQKYFNEKNEMVFKISKAKKWYFFHKEYE